jgi:hypothetical protein
MVKFIEIKLNYNQKLIFSKVVMLIIKLLHFQKHFIIIEKMFIIHVIIIVHHY